MRNRNIPVHLVVTSAFMFEGEMVLPKAVTDGETREADMIEASEAEAINLLNRGKVRLATEDDGIVHGLRTDGPTIAEYVDAGYKAKNYPPEGYASRSTAEEIAAAIDAQAVEKAGKGGKGTAPAEPAPAEPKEPAE